MHRILGGAGICSFNLDDIPADPMGEQVKKELETLAPGSKDVRMDPRLMAPPESKYNDFIVSEYRDIVCKYGAIKCLTAPALTDQQRDSFNFAVDRRALAEIAKLLKREGLL